MVRLGLGSGSGRFGSGNLVLWERGCCSGGGGGGGESSQS